MSAPAPAIAKVPAVEAQGLGKSYGAQWALRDVSLEVTPSESVTLFGANGAGKSTLIKLLATVAAPSRGTLRLFGYNAADHARAVRAAIGVMTHESYLYSELTPLENLRLYADLYGLEDGERRVHDALASVGLEGVGNKRVRELSRGMQQRLSLARATVHAPALLLLDEPDQGLDETGSQYLARALESGRERGQAVVLSTHRLELGLSLCARVLILDRGRVAYSAATSAHTVEEWRSLYASIVRGVRTEASGEPAGAALSR